jgi:hypothetical protein
MARMTREEMDRYDREMMGIVDPRAATPAPVSYQPSPPLNDPEGRPLTREYSLDDIRRFLGFGGRPAMSPAEAADAAQMYVRAQAPAPLARAPLPSVPPGGMDAPAPSIPYMPSTDPRGAAAPIPAPPVPAVPRSAGARPVGRPGAMPANVEAMSPPARPGDPNYRPPFVPMAVPSAGAGMLPGETGVAPQALPGEASTTPMRLNPQQLARAIQRYGRMDLDPNSFAYRFARTQR